jgi:AcrR family transcriptional regulator
VAAIGLFVCLAAAVPVETDPASGASATALDDQWLHMRALLRHRRRGGARVDRSRLQVPAGPPPPRRVISRDQVVAGACTLFLNRGTVDMDQLAISLAISRATLYRVVHSIDELLADVLWRLADQQLTRARAQRTRTGVDGVLQVARGFSRRIVASRPFRRFLSTEPETASRILFTAAGGVHHRAVAAARQLFVEAAPPDQPGGWLRGDLDKLAYLYVRIFESLYYGELLHGATPDIDLVEAAARALLEKAIARPAPLEAVIETAA